MTEKMLIKSEPPHTPFPWYVLTEGCGIGYADASLIRTLPLFIGVCKELLNIYSEWTPDDDPTDVLEWFGNACSSAKTALEVAGFEIKEINDDDEDEETE